MKCFAALLPFLQLAAATSDLQHVFVNPQSTTTIPSAHESAVQARRILNLSSIATLSTVFPASAASTFETRPDDLGGIPIGLMDYYASCGPRSYDPTILAISIATSFKNAQAGSNVTLSIRYHPPSTQNPPPEDLYTYSPANLPRFSLIGHIEALTPADVQKNEIESCFLRSHPDAEAWTPGNPIHESWWARLVVEEIYWIGGFGDRAYIGWIPVSEWRAVTDEEISKTRLIGEKGYSKTSMANGELR
ncbi:pyridoxamine 5'-phosphate oxidase [Physcia stellaris]|nr:pyridoxamine 5'-phosphate oxidase [Physcia stellaris]